MRKRGGLLLQMAIFFSIMMLWDFFSKAKKPEESPTQIVYSDLFLMAQKNELMEVLLITAPGGYKVRAKGYAIATDKKKELKSYETFAPTNNEELLKLLREKNIKHAVNPEPPPSGFAVFFSVILSWLPVLVLIGFWFYMMRSATNSAGKGIMKFMKSNAKLFGENDTKTTFADVAGVDEAKEELKEVIEFLRDPQKFSKLGGRIPKGVLLIGAPGTGKTLLAKAVAGEAEVPFFSISGSNFVEMFVGVGAARVRDLFSQAKQRAPCIIFVDELDAVGRQRGAGFGGGHDEREQTLNQLLVEMDGFNTSTGVIMIAATNRPDVLDPALLRSGRFDRRVVVQRPDVRGREEILRVHAKKIDMAENIDLSVVARGTPGFVGADLEELLNEAALLAAKTGKSKVDLADVESAKDKIIMGAERKSMVISEREKKITAYHEAGHTLVSKSIPGTDPIHKVTVIPRGMALGSTNPLPQEELHNYTKSYLKSQLAILMGGRVAEELVFGDYTTGASNDIQRATEFARKMVCEWGMSEKLGPLKYGTDYENPFLGKQIMEWSKNYSEKTSSEIDREIQKFVTEGYEYAKQILTEKRSKLNLLAEALIIKETLDCAQIDALVNEENQNPPDN